MNDVDLTLPENFENWPRTVQQEWVIGVHALYFPDRLPRLPPDLRDRIAAKAQALGLKVGDAIVLGLEEWADHP